MKSRLRSCTWARQKCSFCLGLNCPITFISSETFERNPYKVFLKKPARFYNKGHFIKSGLCYLQHSPNHFFAALIFAHLALAAALILALAAALIVNFFFAGLAADLAVPLILAQRAF